MAVFKFLSGDKLTGAFVLSGFKTFFFLFGGLALNKVSVKGTIENHYRVMHTDSNILELKNLRTGKTELIEQIIHENEKYLIKQNDTLIINFKKGLLGFNFDPTHRGNFVYPD